VLSQKKLLPPFPITHSPSPIPNYQFPITHYQLPITNYPLPITHYQLPITNSQFPSLGNFLADSDVDKWTTQKLTHLLVTIEPVDPQLKQNDRFQDLLNPRDLGKALEFFTFRGAVVLSGWFKAAQNVSKST
jgi:hypothetical protein